MDEVSTAMRCEFCGCVGVARERFIRGKKERKRFLLLVALLVVPGIIFLLCKTGKPYCVRCKKRVLGIGPLTRNEDETDEMNHTPAASVEALPERVNALREAVCDNEQPHLSLRFSKLFSHSSQLPVLLPPVEEVELAKEVAETVERCEAAASTASELVAEMNAYLQNGAWSSSVPTQVIRAADDCVEFLANQGEPRHDLPTATPLADVPRGSISSPRQDGDPDNE